VNTPGVSAPDIAYHVDCLEREGELLAAAAGRAGLAADVPTCPGWQVRDLLKHTGHVHRWATGYLTHRYEQPVGESSEQEILRAGPADASLAGWFRDGHAALVAALRGADPGLECWTFLPAPSALAFWARRQAHETAIHRADAEQAAAAAGHPAPEGPDGPGYPPRFAADGVDELLMGFTARIMRSGRWHGLPGSLALHAGDAGAGPADWLLVTAPGVAEVRRGRGRADCDVTGAAAAMYLTLWNRRPAAGLTVTGDARLLASFSEQLRVTW
jgi:uncharacterized protein (TIGR03083 family)